MQITGVHHLTAVTGDAPRNLDFYTRTLGMRLVKKTVNQDDDTPSDIVERNARKTLDFEDFEGQRLSLVDDGGAGEAHAWQRSPVPAEHQIRGLGPITISVPDRKMTDLVLTRVLGMSPVRDYATPGNEGSRTYVYHMGAGGPAAELHVAEEPNLPVAEPGAGGVHHVAFHIPD